MLTGFSFKLLCIQDVAAAIHQGLTMSEEEKARRHEPLYKVVTTHTSHTWAAVLVKMLLGQINKQNTARKTPYIPKDKLTDSYCNASKRLLFFDYDVSQVLSKEDIRH
jgi:trehalose 6-phosphate synthase/phosphatase